MTDTIDVAALVERLPPQTAHDLANCDAFLRDARGAYVIHSDEFKLDFGMRLVDAVDALATALQSQADALAEARRKLATMTHQFEYEAKKHSDWLERFMAEEARATTAEASLATMREALERVHYLSLVIESAVRNTDPTNRPIVVEALKSVRAALAGGSNAE